MNQIILIQKKKECNTNIDVMSDYIIVEKPNNNKIKKFIKNVKNIFSTI